MLDVLNGRYTCLPFRLSKNVSCYKGFVKFNSNKGKIIGKPYVCLSGISSLLPLLVNQIQPTN